MITGETVASMVPGVKAISFFAAVGGSDEAIAMLATAVGAGVHIANDAQGDRSQCHESRHQ